VLVAGALALGLLAASTAEAWGVVDRVSGAPDYGAWVAGSIAGAALVIVIVCAGALFLKGRARLLVIGAVVVAEAVGLFIVPELSSPRAASLDLAAVRYLQAHQGSGRVFSLGPLVPNYGAYYGLASLGTMDNPVPLNWSRYVLTRLDPGGSPYAFSGLKYWQTAGSPAPVDELVSHFAAYEDAGVNEIVAPAGVVLPSAASALGVVRVNADPYVQILAVPGASPYFGVVAGGPCVLKAQSRDEIVADCAAPATLVRRELDFPGTGVTLEGRPAPLSTYDGVFEQVRLPAGATRARFSYEPRFALAAEVACLLGLAWTAAALVGASRDRRRRRRAPVGPALAAGPGPPAPAGNGRATPVTMTSQPVPEP
jgi:hypothetical protein